VISSHRHKQSKWRAAVMAGALSLVSLTAMQGSAHAGFLDFLFGGFPDRRPPPQASSYADPGVSVGRVAPAPLGSETVRQGGVGTGRTVAYCVRLCDGQSFRMEHLANATPVETCRAMCPTSKTKVFFGSAIDHAVARDGERYASIDNAFVYRKQRVANCTCNGKDAFGLAPFDVRNDPTLRPGDIVMTKTGPMAYSGKRGETAFTPVDQAALNAALTPPSARGRPAARTEQVADDEPGTIVPSQNEPAQNLPKAAELRGQVSR
jgi:Protein of unknown function (DUF2865)